MLHASPGSILILLPHLCFFFSHSHYALLLSPVYCVCNVNFKNTPNPLLPLELQMQFSLPGRFFLEFPFTLLGLGTGKAPTHKNLRTVLVHSKCYILVTFYHYYYYFQSSFLLSVVILFRSHMVYFTSPLLGGHLSC